MLLGRSIVELFNRVSDKKTGSSVELLLVLLIALAWGANIASRFY